ncbi:MAG: MFS transporter [Firmicutes bacterium HGW-Firmicutes-12]|nr:MAG: MFS transporter [Firmicutes bacterium HGW-Firmicutes-12]
MAIFEETTQKKINKTLSYRYVVFGVIALAYFFVFFHRMSTAVMAKDLATDFGVDPVAVGLFGSMYFYAYALSQLPAGILVDRWGVRKTTTLFTFIAGCATLLFGMANSFNVALTARFLVGLGVAFMYVPALRILADWFRKNEYSTYSSILVAIGNVGALAASAPLAALIVAITWRNTMMIIGVITIIIAALLYIFIRNKPVDIGGASMPEIEQIPLVCSPPISIPAAFKVLFRKYNFWTIIVLYFIWIGTLMAFQGLWAGPYLMNVFNLSQGEAGNILMLIAVGAIVGLPIFGIIADRVMKSKKKVIMIGFISYVLVWIPFVFFTDSMSLNLVRILMFLFGFFGYCQIIVWANVKENVDLVMLGTASGIINFFGFTGGAVYQQLMGVIIAKAPVTNNLIGVASFKAAFLFCFISLLIAFAFYITQKEIGSKRI